MNYQRKFANIEAWAEIVDYHWHRLRGEMFNDAEFWDHTLHAMTDLDWWDWVDVEPAIAIQYEEHYRRYPKLKEDTQEIRQKLMLGKPITRKNGKMKNLTAFRTLMAIHDLVNDMQGTPTRQYPKHTEQRKEHTTPFEALFDVDA